MAEESSSCTDFSSYFQRNMKSFAENIKTSNILPVGASRNNFNVCFPAFTSKIKPYSDQMLDIVSTLLMKEGIKQNIVNSNNDQKVDLVLDGVNKILDRARDNLNVLKGSKSVPVSVESSSPKVNIHAGSWNKNKKGSVAWNANNIHNVKKPIHIQKVIEKPQLKFERKVDNSITPFKPNLESKPNAIKPLAIYLERDVNGVDRYCHPYMHELNSFEVPEHQLEKAEPIQPMKIDSSQILFVDNEESLDNLVDSIKNEKELAIDLEYHNYRSFDGFTCLLQLSTRKQDFIVDTIALRDKLQVLNRFLTDEKILKVLHGSTSDIIWLQKDLNLYLVNMFDTYLASTVLNFPRLSLAFLLKHYCNVDTDKRYQLYDWRVRPLPEAAMTYARGDTHYLLYIYDRLRNELIDKALGLNNLLLSVYSRSTELCKRRYEKTFDVNGYLTLYNQSKQSFDGRQMHALKLLYQWRDHIAREKDESTGYVLPNHMLMQIAEILPREMQGILACCNPVPTLVRQNLFHLHRLITEARNQLANKISDRRDTESMTANKRSILSKLKCPHDFSHHDDFRDNLDTLLSGTDVIAVQDEQNQLKLSVFDENERLQCEDEEKNKKVKLKSVTFVSPYERYKRTVNFMLTQTEKESSEKSDSIEKTDTVPIELEENIHIFRLRSKIDEEMKKDEVEKNNSCAQTENDKNVRLSPVKESLPSVSNESKSGIKRKQQILFDKMPNKKFVRNYDHVAEALTMVQKMEIAQTTMKEEFTLIESDKNKKMETIESIPPMKRKRNRKNKEFKESSSISAQPAVGNSFKPYDYSNVNYNKFASERPKNLKALLNAKISFGTKKKRQAKQNK